LNHTQLGDAIPDGFMENMMPILKGKLWIKFKIPKIY
jgi:hypothetical protein